MIRATADGLGQIKQALQDAHASNPGEEVLGHGGLAHAMHNFVNNWKIHRGKLSSAVEAHQQMASQSADAYEQTDNELAKDLTKHSSSGTGSTPTTPAGGGRKAS